MSLQILPYCAQEGKVLNECFVLALCHADLYKRKSVGVGIYELIQFESTFFRSIILRIAPDNIMYEKSLIVLK